jgi:hypothetical protein
VVILLKNVGGSAQATDEANFRIKQSVVVRYGRGSSEAAQIKGFFGIETVGLARTIMD